MHSYTIKLIMNDQRVKLDNTASLYLQVIINREVLKIKLLLSWPVKFFDKEGGCLIKRNKKDPDFADYNMIIVSEMSKINEIFKVYRLRDKILTKTLFQREYKTYSRRASFLVYMEYKIRLRRSTHVISEGSARLHRSSYRRLASFRSEVAFHEIDKEFLEEFASYLKEDHENNDSTIWGRIKDVKAYLELADLEGIGVNAEFRKYKNKAPAGRLVYMEDDEIERLVGLKNSNSLEKTAHQVLCAFLFSCFTSLRISDVRQVNYGWKDSKDRIRFVPLKGIKRNKEVSVDLNKVAMACIQKTSGTFFSLPSDVEINRSLKDIAKLAEIKKNLTFHVARHTFGTQYYRKSKDIVALQEIMGHAKLVTTMIYVHVSEEDKRNGMLKMEEAYMKSLAVARMVK